MRTNRDEQDDRPFCTTTGGIFLRSLQSAGYRFELTGCLSSTAAINESFSSFLALNRMFTHPI